MAAFDKISSGFSRMDEILHHIRLGDNVVWNRYSDQMFLTHCYRKDTGEFTTLQGGVAMSRYYQVLQNLSAKSQDQNYDSYDRFFNMAKMEYSQGCFREETEDQIIRSTMTKDKKLEKLVKKYFRPEDYFMLRDRMIGSGAIGGKACGMLLARKIAETGDSGVCRA